MATTDHGQPVLLTQPMIGLHEPVGLRDETGLQRCAKRSDRLILYRRVLRREQAPKVTRHQRLLQAVAAGKTLSLSNRPLLPDALASHGPHSCARGACNGEARDLGDSAADLPAGRTAPHEDAACW
jgi:hypothetical protein